MTINNSFITWVYKRNPCLLCMKWYKTQIGSLALVTFENRVPVDAKSFFISIARLKMNK